MPGPRKIRCSCVNDGRKHGVDDPPSFESWLDSLFLRTALQDGSAIFADAAHYGSILVHESGPAGSRPKQARSQQQPAAAAPAADAGCHSDDSPSAQWRSSRGQNTAEAGTAVIIQFQDGGPPLAVPPYGPGRILRLRLGARPLRALPRLSPRQPGRLSTGRSWRARGRILRRVGSGVGAPGARGAKNERPGAGRRAL